MKKTLSLKQQLKQVNLVRAIGCNNPLGAKIAGETGFDAVWFSGFELSTAMCVPDASILTMSDNIYFLSAIARLGVCNIPIIADCDTGYGDLNNVIYMIKEYERIGVNAVSIEDKLFPKLNSFCDGSQRLATKKDFMAKIIAAKEARSSEDFLIFARTEALIDGSSMEEAVDRAYAYAEAGADLIIIHSKKPDQSQIVDFCEKFKSEIPLGVIPTTYFKTTGKSLSNISDMIKLVIYANHGIRASIKAIQNTYAKILASDSTEFCEQDIATIEQAFRYQRIKEHQEDFKKYNKFADLLLKL